VLMRGEYDKDVLVSTVGKNRSTVTLRLWLICDWVRDLTVLMHLGLRWQALCALYRFMGALLHY
jgi:hypothetical protein